MNEKDPLHSTVKECFEYCLEKRILPITSTVCIAEYSVKANPDLIAPQIKVIPFSFEAAKKAGDIYEKPDSGDKRDAVKDDYKIIASAIVLKCDFIVTVDAKTFKKYAERSAKHIKTILLSENSLFSPQCFNDGLGEDLPLLDISNS